MIENTYYIITHFFMAFFCLFLLIISIIPPIFSIYRLIKYGLENLRPENHQTTTLYILFVAIPTLGIISFLNGNHPVLTAFAFLINGWFALEKGMLEVIFEEFNIPKYGKRNGKEDIIEGVFTVIEENNIRPQKLNGIGDRL